jgi:dissimilatory sulfite reductase (desulfoviridin) alpha/beta subunit
MEAEEAVRKVPFFVRKRVKSRVEKEAESEGKSTITVAEVRATQARYLTQMETDIRGFQVETCFGSGGCPNRILSSDPLMKTIQGVMSGQNLLAFLRERVSGGLKYHHEFRITMAECPNACSQPQIRDFGLIAASQPRVTDEPCSGCGACVDICKEAAVVLDPKQSVPAIGDACVRCGQCIDVCPTGTLSAERTGYRILLGGKLGRHPRLAVELPGIHSEKEVVLILRDCLSLYRERCLHGERFGELISDSEIRDRMAKWVTPRP